MVDEHTKDDIWKRLNDQGDRIGEIRSGQAATDAKLNALDTAMDAGFRTISTEMRHLGDRVYKPEPPVNYAAYIAAIFGLLAVFGGYALLITSPMKELTTLITQSNALRIEYQQKEIDDLKEHRQQTAELRAYVDVLREQAKEARLFQLEAAYIHGQREELGKRVDDIDTYGSRRWNESRDKK